MNTKFLLTAVATLALSACATAPKPLQGQFSLVSPRDSVATQQVGTPVRWGGRIIETKPGQGETCFQIISRPLNGSGRPNTTSSDASDGRFIAQICSQVVEVGPPNASIHKIDEHIVVASMTRPCLRPAAT